METAVAKLETHYENLIEDMKEIKLMIKENTKISQDTLSQVVKTNGRVTALELKNEKEIMPIIEEYKSTREQAKGAWKLWLVIGTGVISMLGICGAVMYDYIKKDISVSIINSLEKTYGIEIRDSE